MLADHLESHDRKGAWELATSLLNMLAIIMGAIGVIILLFAEPLLHLVAPGLTPEQKHNAAIIMRFVAFNPFLFTISGILTAVQQTFGRFFFYAIAPLFYNVAIIASIFFFRDNIGIVGLGIGAFIGAVLQLLVVLFGLGGLNFVFHRKIKPIQHISLRNTDNLEPFSLGLLHNDRKLLRPIQQKTASTFP